MSASELARRVVSFHRRSLAIAGLEALAIGVSAALLALAAARSDGADLRDVAVIGVAIGTGLFGGVAFFGERRPTARASVRRLDRGLAADGAVETAWENRSSGSSVGALLMRRATALATRALPARAPSPAFLGAPLVALALVLAADTELAMDVGSLERSRPDRSSSGAGSPTDDTSAEPSNAVAEARLERARRVQDRLRAAADPAERALAEAEWGALEGGLPPDERSRLEPAGDASGRAAERDGDGSLGAESDGSGADGWSGRGSAGMMSGRSAPAETGPAAPRRGVPTPEAAVSPAPTSSFGWLGSEPWPAEYEELIERWLDRRAR